MTARLGRYPTHLDGLGPTAAIAPPLERLEDEEAILLLLDPEADLDCCKQNCELHADWYRRCRSCSALYPVCDHHRHAEVVWLLFQGWVGCTSCPAMTFGVFWETIFEYIPLRGTQ